jgi:GntR family transcriptional repressor for pyruvate dehydrogenase complex
MVFRPIKTTRIADNVFQQIKASIERGDFKIGDKLPGERTLAEQFSVNRAGVREALRVLEAVGMVEVRHGLGCYAVRDTVTQDAPSIWVPWLSVHRDDVLALLDVRESLETKAASLAAEMITDDELTALKALLDQMSVAADDPEMTTEALSSLDVRFHDMIARASKNKFLIQLLSHLSSATETDRYAIFAVPRRAVRSGEEHAAILAAIGDRNPKTAGEAMMRHVEEIRETIKTLNAAEVAST